MTRNLWTKLLLLLFVFKVILPRQTIFTTSIYYSYNNIISPINSFLLNIIAYLEHFTEDKED